MKKCDHYIGIETHYEDPTEYVTRSSYTSPDDDFEFKFCPKCGIKNYKRRKSILDPILSSDNTDLTSASFQPWGLVYEKED